MLFLPSLLTYDSLNILDKFYNNKLEKISFYLQVNYIVIIKRDL